ncbi:MAG: DUF441 domain-containing protein [Bacillota bacterium]|nr:DUF441 domain-containing protein [Bacillota bacterium]
MIYKAILIILIVLSFITKNKNMTIAAFAVLVLSIINSEKLISFSEKYFMDIGMTFLMIWMLIPLLKIQGSFSSNIKDMLNFKGMVSFAAGIAVVLLAAKGVNYLKGSADTLTGVILGSIIGVALLGGIPVGPLVASGLAYEFMRVFGFISKKGL